MDRESPPEEPTAMNICDLPIEILTKICDGLTLSEKKTVSTVCRKFEEAAFHAGSSYKGVLWLNKIGVKSNRFGGSYCSDEFFIDRDVLAQSKRAYRMIGIELSMIPNHEKLAQLEERVKLVLKNTTKIKELHLVDTHAMQMAHLVSGMPFLFEKLERLIVKVQGYPIPVLHTVELQMPSLLYLEWHEQNANHHPMPNTGVAIILHAPKLQSARIREPEDQEEVIGEYRCLAQIASVGELRTLETILNGQFVDLLRNDQLPKLEQLTLDMQRLDNRVEWKVIVPRMVKLKQLKLTQDPLDTISSKFLGAALEHCPKLRVLSLEWINISELLRHSWLWRHIYVLHMHNCRAEVPENETITLTLCNVRNMCYSFTESLSGSLVINAPKVRLLGCSNTDEGLEIMDTPELETLIFGAPQCKTFHFLRQPMPKLRKVMIDLSHNVTRQDLAFYNDVMISTTANVEHLVLKCRSGRAATTLLNNLNIKIPSLKSIKIIGKGQLTKISSYTLRVLFRMPRLQSLTLINLQVTDVMRQGIPLPPQLVRLRIRSLCIPWNSNFIITRGCGKRTRLGNLQ